MKPWEHALVGVWLAGGMARCGLPVRLPGVLLGSVLPDIDFLLLVPVVGRLAGHRTITHAPVFHIGVALVLRRLGFWSMLAGQLCHSLTDSMGPGKPRGVAWAWPVLWRRVDIIGRWFPY